METRERELLEKVANFIEENDMYSELRNTPMGPFLLFSDTAECSKIEEFARTTLGVDDLPCSMGYMDEHKVCDCCGKVFCTTPDSAFWKKNWITASDGQDYCEDCVTIEMIIEENNHHFDRIDSILSIKDYEDAGFEDYCKSKYQVDNVEDTKIDYETLMEEVKDYEYAIFLMLSATPFEIESKLMVKK